MKGGKREGAGRPVAVAPKSAVFQVRCTEAQRRAIVELGGAKWVLRKLGEAQESTAAARNL